MKSLMTSTALVAILFVSGAHAEDKTGAAVDDSNQAVLTAKTKVENTKSVTGFHIAHTDHVLANDIIGATIYRSAKDDADELGEVRDILMAPDGQALGVLASVGGLLGIGDKLIAMSFDKLSWRIDADGAARLVADFSHEQLEAAPEFVRSQVKVGARQIEQNRKTTFEAAGLEASDIIGMTVHGAKGEDVGEISEILIGNDGGIEAFLVDVGGFLGIAEKPVAVAFENLYVSRTGGDEKWSILHTSLTADQLEDQAAYDKDGYKTNQAAYLIRPVF